MTRGQSWDRMRLLAQQRSLTGGEIEELATLYRSATADLAKIRSTQSDPDVVRLLSRDLAMARSTLTGTHGTIGYTISRWFRRDLPAALYDIRWWTIGTATAFLVIAAVHCLYLLLNPELFAHIGTPTQLRQFAKVDFVQYYNQDTNSEFATSVWVHNSFLTMLGVGSGITGFGPVYLLQQNAASLGSTSAIVFTYGGVWHFFRYLLPHGMPELTAVFIGCAAGLRTFWALLVPGSMTRMESVARTGRSMITIALGLVILLFLSGILEGFVTPSQLPDWLRLLLGFLVMSGVWIYTLVVGRAAHLAGYSGDLNASAAGYMRQVN